MHQKFKYWLASTMLGFSFPVIGYAAKPIDLSRQNEAVHPSFTLISLDGMKEISRSVDTNKITHVRLKQTYLGHDVWGGDAVLHIPQDAENNLSKNKNSMNGIFYQDINKDLDQLPASFLSSKSVQKATEKALEIYRHDNSNPVKSLVRDKKANLIIYIDKQNKSHWVYHINFYVAPAQNHLPAKPNYLIDAATLQVYKKWNEVKTALPIKNSPTMAGGFGGHQKIGKLIYDDASDHLAALAITRDSKTKTCSLKNRIVTVKNVNTGNKVIKFPCDALDPKHGEQLYWDGDLEAVNGGYSPANDALFAGLAIKNMYQLWYHESVLRKKKKPMILNMLIHEKMDNAYWDGEKMVFGDGVEYFYPLTSLGVASHEISHGFTEQHSGLIYDAESGGMNEAFSDMAAQAAEFFSYGKNNWQIGAEIVKEENKALRYMDQPSKDCGKNARPGEYCSIDKTTDYYDGLDVHFSSGVFNRAFYLMATTPDWNTRKAFDVMVQANMYYWTPASTFEQGACGVVKAAKDLKYETEPVVKAFEMVGIDTSRC